MSCHKNITNECRSKTHGSIHPNVPDGTYFISEIEVSNKDITNITTHRDANGNIFEGSGAVVSGSTTNGIVIGTNSTITDSADSTVVGYTSVCNAAFNSAAVGSNLTCNVPRSVCVGNYAKNINADMTSTKMIAIGDFAETNANRSTAIGDGARTSTLGERGIALGTNADCNNSDCITIGYNATADGQESTAIGTESYTTGQYSCAFGYQSRSQGEGCLTVGYNNNVYGEYCTALGENNNIGTVGTPALLSTGIGNNINITSDNQLVLGGDNQYNNVFINNLNTNTSASISSVFNNVQYNSATHELSYSAIRSGVLIESGSFTISSVGSQDIVIGFSPVNIRIMLNVGLSNGSSQSGNPDRFSVNCTTYNATRTYYYVATG